MDPIDAATARLLMKLAQRTAEQLELIPEYLVEFEFNMIGDKIESVEYWTSVERRPEDHTLVDIPTEYKPVFNVFGKKFKEIADKLVFT
jgi:hypothetical protein